MEGNLMGTVVKEVQETSISAMNLLQYGMGMAAKNPALIVGVGALLLLKNKKLKLGKILDLKL